MVKILVIGDLHGVKPRIHFKDFDCIVQPGDVCSDKLVRPVYKKWFKYIKDVGVENVDVSFEEFFDSYLGKGGYGKANKEQMKDGRKVLKYLNSFGRPVFIVPGNWDNSYGSTRIKDMEKNDYNHDRIWIDWWLGKSVNKKLTKGFKNIYDCQYSCFEFEGVNFIGYGNNSGPEKFKEKLKKHKYSKEEKIKLKEKIRELYSRLENLFRMVKGKPSVFISHNIPYGVLDIGLDKKSYAYKKHLGSTVAKDIIEKFQPLVCVGGHIHEYHGKKKLGKTTVINAGFGRNVNTLIDIDEVRGKVQSVRFWDGKK
jgi:Icc-related predicted phosphoesterase